MSNFRHKKGGKYTLITVARHSETGEELVIYAGCGEGANGIWARPAKMFFEREDGQLRFMPIKQYSEQEILEIAESYDARLPERILNIVMASGTENAEEFIRTMRRNYDISEARASVLDLLDSLEGNELFKSRKTK